MSLRPSRIFAWYSRPRSCLSSCIARRIRSDLLQPPHATYEPCYTARFLNAKAERCEQTSNIPSDLSCNLRENLSRSFDPSNRASYPTKSCLMPTTCPGCGALSQTVNSTEAGFYSTSRNAVKVWLKQGGGNAHQSLQEAMAQPSDHDLNEHERISHSDKSVDTLIHISAISQQPETPVCDRCHDIIYNNKGESIAHPSVEDLADSIAESPFDRNHVYHVLDAADFPMSLLPSIFKTLELAKPRGQNRRARVKYTTKPTVSFIITRSDLLGPSKEMVDRMMPYFQKVLRAALGRSGQNIRLGNVHLVSSKRGWWTKELKDNIWERGGGNWLVGKANVGKSNLFPVLFPKGSGERAPSYFDLREAQQTEEAKPALRDLPETYLAENSLLPPPQPEARFPAMPIVSHLPGTTASPIRLPYGNHKGELIDLPGLDRGGLERYVQTDHRLDLVMQHRPNVKQHVIGPGQSLLLGGGLIRITPQLDDTDLSTTVLAYPFVPINAHVTATHKAVSTQLRERVSGIHSILASDSELEIRSSGLYSLNTDVTKSRASPLLRAGVPLSKLPFKVYSSDILIEGVGWIELVCQVRRTKFVSTSDLSTNPSRDHPATSEHFVSTAEFEPFSNGSSKGAVQHKSDPIDEFPCPKVEIFSPEGRYIGQRPPLGAWLLWTEGKEQSKAKASVRPRKSMKGAERKGKTSSATDI